jgi:hypothetical protein
VNKEIARLERRLLLAEDTLRYIAGMQNLTTKRERYIVAKCQEALNRRELADDDVIYGWLTEVNINEVLSEYEAIRSKRGGAGEDHSGEG